MAVVNAICYLLPNPSWTEACHSCERPAFFSLVTHGTHCQLQEHHLVDLLKITLVTFEQSFKRSRPRVTLMWNVTLSLDDFPEVWLGQSTAWHFRTL